MKFIDRHDYFFKAMLLFIFCISGSISANAQFKVYGIVTTPEKKKFHGEVITYEPQESVTLNCQGDTLTWQLDNNKAEFKFTTRKPPKKYNFPLEVGYHRLSLGALPGRPNEGAYISYSYTFQKSLFLGYGGGIAFENYGDNQGYDFIVPRATYIGYFREENASPFLKADVGYGIAIKNTGKNQTAATGGFNFGVGLGYRLSTNRVMIDFAVGTRFQKGSYEFDEVDFIKVEDILFKRIDIGIGFMW